VDNAVEARRSLDNSGLRLIMKLNPTRKLSVWQADAPASRVCHPFAGGFLFLHLNQEIGISDLGKQLADLRSLIV